MISSPAQLLIHFLRLIVVVVAAVVVIVVVIQNQQNTNLGEGETTTMLQPLLQIKLFEIQ